jgi:DNA-binding LytR/AlgR family response regulator
MSYSVNLNYVTKYRRGDGGTSIMSDESERVLTTRRVKPVFLKKMELDC